MKIDPFNLRPRIDLSRWGWGIVPSRVTEHELGLDRQFSAASAEMRTLYLIIMVKGAEQENSQLTSRSTFQSHLRSRDLGSDWKNEGLSEEDKQFQCSEHLLGSFFDTSYWSPSGHAHHRRDHNYILCSQNTSRVTGERDVWNTLLRLLLLCHSIPDHQKINNGYLWVYMPYKVLIVKEALWIDENEIIFSFTYTWKGISLLHAILGLATYLMERVCEVFIYERYCLSSPTYLDDVVNVDLPILVVVQGLGNPLQLVLWNVLDLPHDADQFINADQVFPEGVEQTAYRKQRVTRCNGHVVARSQTNMLHSRFPDHTNHIDFHVSFWSNLPQSYWWKWAFVLEASLTDWFKQVSSF